MNNTFPKPILLIEISIKNEKGYWETLRYFKEEEQEEKNEYINLLQQEEKEVREQITKVKPRHQLMREFVQLLKESEKNEYITGENIIKKAIRLVQ